MMAAIICTLCVLGGMIVVTGGILAMMDTYKNEQADLDELRRKGLL